MNAFQHSRYILIFIGFLACPAFADAGKVISIRAAEWMPYNGGENSQLPGYTIEIAKYAFNKQGFRIDYKTLTWPESVKTVARGDADCVIATFRSDAKDFVFQQQTLGMEDVAFYTRKDSRAWRFEGLKSFDGYSLALTNEQNFGPLMDFYIANPNHDVQVAKGMDAFEQNINRLLKKEVDILVESPVIYAYKHRFFPSTVNIKEQDRMNKPEAVYFACSPKKIKSEKYVQMFDEGLTELRENGQLEKILEKYGLKDWQ